MENLPFVILLSIFFMTASLMFFYIRRLKFKFLQNNVSKKFANKYLYSSLLIKDICYHILKQNSLKYRKMTECLTKNKILQFYNLVNDELIKSKINICDKKISKKFIKDIGYQLALAKLYIKENKYDKGLKILQNLQKNKMSSAQKACFRYLMGQISLYESDLLIATEDFSFALKIFKKKNMLFEEAETYFMLGTAYRVSGVYDTAELMLKTSADLFSKTFSFNGEAEALGTLGLLMSVQNRFEEAHSYFQKALDKTSQNKTLRSFILSQIAMLELVEGHHKQALNFAKESLEQTKSDIAKANGYDVLSRVNMAEKHYASAVKNAVLAFDLFFKNHNYSAAFESLYIKAFALSKAKRLDESEKNLRFLLEIEKKHKHCFHIAGAYTLLGVVLLNKDQPDRAKSMFNLALSKELCNNRKTGVAIDYTNLAIVEKLQGNIEKAYENIQKALSQSNDLDENIISIIKNSLN